jgi:hypothetical protein
VSCQARSWADGAEAKEARFFAPSELADLNIHPSMLLRINHYLERRAAPYIG